MNIINSKKVLKLLCGLLIIKNSSPFIKYFDDKWIPNSIKELNQFINSLLKTDWFW